MSRGAHEREDESHLAAREAGVGRSALGIEHDSQEDVLYIRCVVIAQMY